MNVGVCPVCNGAGRVSLSDYDKTFSWNKGKTHKKCGNCGGQYMYGTPTGQVRLREDGTPCVHKYVSKNIGRCYNEYTCKHCGDVHAIDSSD